MAVGASSVPDHLRFCLHRVADELHVGGLRRGRRRCAGEDEGHEKFRTHWKFLIVNARNEAELQSSAVPAAGGRQTQILYRRGAYPKDEVCTASATRSRTTYRYQ